MKKTKYTVKYTTCFKKDYKRAIKRGLKIELLEQVVTLLAMGERLPDKNRDHDLSGDWAGHRECHILTDWLLVYRIEDDVLVLTLARTGTHSDLFGEINSLPLYGETCMAVFCIVITVGVGVCTIENMNNFPIIYPVIRDFVIGNFKCCIGIGHLARFLLWSDYLSCFDRTGRISPESVWH